MDWHIITSSKGGSGKTLISLMLLLHHRNRGENVLVIDLNGMNADLRRLVAEKSFYHQRDFQNNFLELELSLGNKSDQFYLESLAGENQGYVICWPRNAFKIFNPTDFCDFLSRINQACKGGEIKQKFGEINTVIIDTSYHFCNIFPETPASYAQGPLASLKDDNIFIWFLWVYRQLHNLMTAGVDPKNPFDIDAITVTSRATLIETQMELGNLTNNMLESSPFVHVFSPVFLGQVNEGIINKLFRWISSEGEIETIMPLKKLIALDRRNQSIEFNDLVKQLREAYKAVLGSSNTTTDVHSFFLNILELFVDALPSEPGSRYPISPRNIIPLHIYQKNLLGYADADYQNLLNDLGGLEVYKESFQKTYKALLK